MVKYNIDHMAGFKPFKPFQIRWKESFGDPDRPYLYRWSLILFNFSIRLHHWIRSDDTRYFHDHSCNLISIILKGRYTNVTPKGRFKVKAGSIWFAKADAKHYLVIPKGGAWTLLLCGRPYRKWGFWVKGKKMRPWRYFRKFGVFNENGEQYLIVNGEPFLLKDNITP